VPFVDYIGGLAFLGMGPNEPPYRVRVVFTVVTYLDVARVRLKDAFLPHGRRIGVAKCCPESAPCAWHAALSQIERGPWPVLADGSRSKAN